jgi:hypothetical protein
LIADLSPKETGERAAYFFTEPRPRARALHAGAIRMTDDGGRIADAPLARFTSPRLRGEVVRQAK